VIGLKLQIRFVQLYSHSFIPSCSGIFNSILFIRIQLCFPFLFYLFLSYSALQLRNILNYCSLLFNSTFIPSCSLMLFWSIQFYCIFIHSHSAVFFFVYSNCFHSILVCLNDLVYSILVLFYILHGMKE